jgi:seryl-tRNA synthetase
MAIDLGKLSPEELESKAAEREMSVEDFKVVVELENRAEAEGRTVEEIAAEDNEIKGLVEKHGGDTKAIAKALLHSTRGATKKIEEELRSKRSLEDKVKTLEEQLGKLSTAQRQDVMDYLKKQYPDMDENILKIVHEVSSMQTQYAVNSMRTFYANDRLDGEKLQF